MKKLLTITLIGVLALSMGAIAFADGFDNPAEVYSNLTEKTLDEAYELRSDGKTYGELAKEAGKLDEFRKANLENKISIINERVDEGLLTQKEADEIIETMKDMDCTTLGENRFNQKYNLGFGQGNGQGFKRGNGQGFKRGRGNHQGFRRNAK